MKVLHVTPSFYPATYWGGPIFSTKAICDGIAAAPDIRLRVLTTDAAGPALRDRLRQMPLPYRVDYTRRIAGHAVAPGLLARLPAAMLWADVVHLTGTYSFPTLPVLALARILRKPLVWSPRGALQATQAWPDAPHLRAKHLFEQAANMLRPAQTILHVTAPLEAAQSLARLPHIQTTVIPNSVTIPPVTRRPYRPRGLLRLIYLGRLHPKKGLDLLIAAMAVLPGHVTLDIFGTGNPAYVAKLREAAAGDARIRFHGALHSSAKAQAFARADLCVLPSHSENFGITVAEALAHRVPVLTTISTPWRRLAIMAAGACIDPARDDLAEAILRLGAGDLAAMGARGRDWMIRDFAPEAMVASFAALYRNLVEGEPQMVNA
ncbi:glycosyltransferase [Yoonia vestfoldensis]|jgi:glycosyltransferase involved in cell wall biosynthesis|uniref:Glycogen synthase n=1 Tax=Yoonia vestfoldensis TaxID=245188 RepID=A0A1Y0ED95_9RHOB|nr:glycosyltransferase [Yoonia vestfoldensis]ARU01553.1 glycogen synthase [Yoonia vestfoldensis]